MYDFRIEEMHRRPEGYFAGTVLSLRSQRTFHVHNRWGAWFIGEQDAPKGAAMKDMRSDLAAALQAHKIEMEKSIEKIADNPFVVAANNNPFMQLAS